jgi:hypothetical protein
MKAKLRDKRLTESRNLFGLFLGHRVAVRCAQKTCVGFLILKNARSVNEKGRFQTV